MSRLPMSSSASRRPLSSLNRMKGISASRYLHWIKTDFIAHDAKGKLVTTKVDAIIGNPGESYVMMAPRIGSAFRAACPSISASSAAVPEDKCKLSFFHDTQHFGFAPSSYPRLYVPTQLPRQSRSNTSPATLFLTGAMHEMVLDGTFDAVFAQNLRDSLRNLGPVLDRLKDM